MTRLGIYVVEDEIGHGGMGVVLRARAPDGSLVAIKILRGLRGDALPRFERERRLIGSFTARDGFVPLLDSGTSPRGPYIVMPLLTGGTLRARLDAGPLAVDEAVRLGRSLARALGRAHERGIVHRDVKPENVLFTQEGEPLVADLGLAKHFDRDAPGASRSVALTDHGTMRGTASYMAPEQAADAASAGPRADVFSLGVVLYECLAGRHPFRGANLIETLGAITTGHHEALASARPDTPAWLVDAIEKALALDPASRFSDCLAFERALGARKASGPKRRSWALRAGVAVVGALALVGVAWTSRVRPRAAATVVPSRVSPVASSGAAAPSGRRDARGEALRSVERAALLWRAGDRDGAIAGLSAAIELDPTFAAAWDSRGSLRLEMRDWKGAIADSTRAIELDGTVAAFWVNRAGSRLNMGDAEGALADSARAIELDPKLAHAWANLGGARAGLQDWTGALVACDRAIELDPSVEYAWTSRGTAKWGRGDWDGAIADCTRAIELGATSVAPWSTRGAAKLEKRDLVGAIADCTRAIELDPTRAFGWRTRSIARARQGDLAGAIDDGTRAIELDPSRPLNWTNRGASRQQRGDLDGAIADYTEALERDPGSTLARFNRGWAKSQKGDRDGAIADFERYLELAPDDPHTARPELERLRGAVR